MGAASAMSGARRRKMLCNVRCGARNSLILVLVTTP